MHLVIERPSRGHNLGVQPIRCPLVLPATGLMQRTHENHQQQHDHHGLG